MIWKILLLTGVAALAVYVAFLLLIDVFFTLLAL